MLKRFIQSCAATAVLAPAAFALDVGGTYTAQTAQGPLTVELRQEQERVGGVVHYGGQAFPITGSQAGGRLNGMWEFQGQAVPFAAAFDGNMLTLNTNGAVYQLQRAGANTDGGAAFGANNSPLAPAQQQPAPQQPAPQVDVQQGRIFSYALPRGWRSNETICGVDMMSPDGATVVSHVVFRGFQGRSSPDQMIQYYVNNPRLFNIANPRIISSQPINENCKAFVLSFVSQEREVKAVSICTAMNQPLGGFITDTMQIQAPPETFERDAPFLMQLARGVTCTNPSAVCGNDQLIHLQPPSGGGASLNHPNTAGDVIMKGWEGRNKVMDQIALQRSDVNRGQTRWQGSDGTQYVAPNSAERVFVTPGGTGSYSNNVLTPPPANTDEARPYTYGR